MDFTKEQISELICKHSEKENGLQDILEMFIQGMMLVERRAYLDEEGLPGNKCNGFRPGRTYGQGRTLTFRIPRDRYGNFHPTILAMLRSQEDECERLAGTLYTKGLTQEQVGEVFADIYGERYSKASISRMLDYLRRDVAEWLGRSLEGYYPIVFVDCVHIKIHRKRSVDTEAFYVALAVPRGDAPAGQNHAARRHAADAAARDRRAAEQPHQAADRERALQTGRVHRGA